MDSTITNKKDLVVEPLELKHLIMLNVNDELNQFRRFQLLLYKMIVSSIETYFLKIPTRNPTCFVAIEDNNIVAYILATPNNSRSSCWTISEPQFIAESLSYSRYNIFQSLIKKVLYESKIRTKSYLTYLNTNDNQHLSIAREAGFQPLRIIKYWRKESNNSDVIEKTKTELNLNWTQINLQNVQQLWRLEQARESVSLRSIFDRQWNDIYKKRTSITGVISDENNKILAGLITSFCPSKENSLELIRGLAWDQRLYQSIPNHINRIQRINKNVSIETTSEDKQLNELMIHSGWNVLEEKILLGRNIWRREKTSNVKSVENNLSAILANLQQQPELPSTLKINKLYDQTNPMFSFKS